MTPGQGAARLTRAAAFAVSAVGLAAAAHAAGGGSVNPTTAIVAVPAVAAVMNLLARRRRGLATLLPALAATQLVLHEAFMATSAGGCHTVPKGAMGAMGGMGASIAMHCPSMHQSMSTAMSTATSTAMLAGHAVATLLTALLLARGEAAIWTLAQWLGLRSLPAPAPLGHPAALARPAGRDPRPATTFRVTPINRRGPPEPVLAT